MEADISQLEAPTFTTITRGPPEPMLRLKWDHKVNLIGEKVLNPMIHCCDQCEKPILIYGRMIPCKHVFCLRCARSEFASVKMCPRCKEKAVRVEQSGLGTVFMCTHGGSRYGNTGCRRTYLSQRDLQAHINHRHVTPAIADPKMTDAKVPVGVQRKPLGVGDRSPSRQPATRPNQPFGGSTNQTSPATTGRGNLIPIPIQELQQQSVQPITSAAGNTLHHHQVQSTAASDLGGYSYGHGQGYGSIMSTAQSGQTQQFSQLGIQGGLSGSGAQAVNVSTASQFYAPYGSYNTMQTNQSNTNYTNSRSTYDQVGNNYQANNVSMQQSSQQQWQQQYYR